MIKSETINHHFPNSNASFNLKIDLNAISPNEMTQSFFLTNQTTGEKFSLVNDVVPSSHFGQLKYQYKENFQKERVQFSKGNTGHNTVKLFFGGSQSVMLIKDSGNVAQQQSLQQQPIQQHLKTLQLSETSCDVVEDIKRIGRIQEMILSRVKTIEMQLGQTQKRQDRLEQSLEPDVKKRIHYSPETSPHRSKPNQNISFFTFNEFYTITETQQGQLIQSKIPIGGWRSLVCTNPVKKGGSFSFKINSPVEHYMIGIVTNVQPPQKTNSYIAGNYFLQISNGRQTLRVIKDDSFTDLHVSRSVYQGDTIRVETPHSGNRIIWYVNNEQVADCIASVNLQEKDNVFVAIDTPNDELKLTFII